MEKVKTGVRIFLGIGLIFVGLNKFGAWWEPPANEAMLAWMETLRNTGFLFELIAIFQMVTGLLLVINKFVPLALLMILPIMVIAFLSHIFMDIEGMGGSVVFLSLIILNIIWNKTRYKELLKA